MHVVTQSPSPVEPKAKSGQEVVVLNGRETKKVLNLPDYYFSSHPYRSCRLNHVNCWFKSYTTETAMLCWLVG
ncbi:hypothetical protein P8452_66208 [Trifolium repens]|nr:hypothetical protein P8452_66208 [Trifolium repens]